MLSYTTVELRSLLPSGWNLAAGERGRQGADPGRYEVMVVDPADVTWPLVVDRRALEASDGDRLGALRCAIDDIYRKALG